MTSRRSRAREVALQMLFQFDQNAKPVPREALEAFARDRLHGDVDAVAFGLSLYDGVLANLKKIDERISETAENWRLSRMLPVDRNVLRLGTYELEFAPETAPVGVAVDEAIELSRRYGSADSPAFVNGILDKIAKKPKQLPAESTEKIAANDSPSEPSVVNS
ncbi:MAG TPA: transcription antitermination factor NusB [Fimbriiglobus sp.]|jgi:N utilization substance protein B